MKLDNKKRIIDKGRSQLEKGMFPDKLILSISEKRLRDDISKQIFAIEPGKKLDDLEPNEKKVKKSQLKVRRAFYDIINAPQMARKPALLLLLMGLILLTTAQGGLNSNLIFAISSVVSSLVIILFSFYRDQLLAFILPLGIIYTFIFIIELIVFGFPDPLLAHAGDNMQIRRRTGLVLIFNQMTPIIIVTLRLIVGGVLFYFYYRLLKYNEEKAKFENDSKLFIRSKLR